jgi:DNA-binding transcriptional MerR regulator
VSISTITAQELADACDERLAAINHWTTIGLLNVVGRDGRTRLYDRQKSIARCAKIRELQNKGYLLGNIRDQLADGE